MEKMDYKSFVISVQGIAQMILDGCDLGLVVKATVCETDRDGKHYMGVDLRNVTETHIIALAERYYLEEMYADYLKGEISIAEIAQMMVTEYIMKLDASLEEE